ncbi:hypothetical protein C806_05014 [Lachnospiraceae bacterium 3-1]|nr:hypothetical protein C806_05014 [Lachnospiraceae bacterium 3-1]
MHYTGTIWRPPYEAGSALVQATAGCTHHKCRFCTLYEDVPFKELCKNKFTVLAIYGIMAIRRYDHGRTNSYYAAIT